MHSFGDGVEQERQGKNGASYRKENTSGLGFGHYKRATMKETIPVWRVIHFQARMFLSAEAYALYNAFLFGQNVHTSYVVDLELYKVTPKEWIEAYNFASRVLSAK